MTREKKNKMGEILNKAIDKYFTERNYQIQLWGVEGEFPRMLVKLSEQTGFSKTQIKKYFFQNYYNLVDLNLVYFALREKST